MFAALVLQLGFVGLIISRAVLYPCLPKITLLLTYVLLYGYFAWLITRSVQESLDFLAKSEWLSPNYLPTVFPAPPLSSAEQADIFKVVQLGYTLRFLSVLALPLTVLTWFAGAWGTCKHMFFVLSGGDARSCELRDHVLQIRALPMVYGFMALKAIMRMWEVCENSYSPQTLELIPSFYERMKIMTEVYDANYEVAEFYEAIALFHFGKMCLRIIKDKCEGKDSLDEESARTVATLNKSLVSLTMQGIWSFVAGCGAQSLFMTLSVQFDPEKKYLPEDFRMKLHFIFMGLGIMASSAAIGNVVLIEQNFHSQLEAVKPFWKFWGTKILVSFAFIQSLLFMLPIWPLQELSVVQTNLAYSSLMCVECFGVSILHDYAFAAKEVWYGDLDTASVASDDAYQRLS